MRVLLLTRYGRMGPSSRLRSYQYLPYLAGQGIEVTAAPLLDDEYLKNLYGGRSRRAEAIAASYWHRLGLVVHHRRFDLIWIEKELFPWLPGWVEEWLAARGIPYVVDYDDAVFHRYDQHPNPLIRAMLGRKLDKVMRGAALVITGNDYLAERARGAGARRVEYLPTVVDLNRYPLVPRRKGSGFIVGWIGSPTTAKYLQVVQPAIRELAVDGQTRLVSVGSGPINLPGVPLEIRSWAEDTETAEISEFDVGIMPLTDGPWERGKCGLKLLQCMAVGRAVVASPIGANRKIVEEEVNGFWASTTEEWIRALETLRDQPDLRERMGLAGRRKVEAEYSLQAAAPRLAELLKRAIRQV